MFNMKNEARREKAAFPLSREPPAVLAAVSAYPVPGAVLHTGWVGSAVPVLPAPGGRCCSSWNSDVTENLPEATGW